MLGWAFEPADDDMLLTLIDCGRRDAKAWAEQTGVAAVAAESGLGRSEDESSPSSVVVLPDGIRTVAHS